MTYRSKIFEKANFIVKIPTELCLSTAKTSANHSNRSIKIKEYTRKKQKKNTKQQLAVAVSLFKRVVHK